MKTKLLANIVALIAVCVKSTSDLTVASVSGSYTGYNAHSFTP